MKTVNKGLVPVAITVIIVVVGAVALTLFLSGNLTGRQSTPEATISNFLDNVIKGDYDKAFNYMVDVNGTPLSQETRQRLKDLIEKAPISGYQIKGTTDMDLNSPRYNAFNGAKIVSFTVTRKDTGKPEDTYFSIVQHEGTWKILWY